MVYQRLNFRRFFNYFLPGACYLCRNTINEQALICADCRQDLPRNYHACDPHGRAQATIIDQVIAPYAYRFPVNKLIRQLKYNQKISLAHAFGLDITDDILKVCTSLPDCILPVPLHRRRQLARGYNQAEEIARTVARELSVPLNSALLYRSRNTLAQFDLSPAARRRNIQGAFKLRAAPAYKSVAIIDDVITTGVTVTEVARLLKRAGVKRVEAWACARTPPHGPG